ncbi:GumC family protein [Candidatus Poribacteria bacterium]
MEAPTRLARKEIHLRDYFIVLDRYKWLIIAIVLITLSTTALYLSRQMPIYQAKAKMIIEPKQIAEAFSSQSEYNGTGQLDLGTQIAAIKTTPVLASVAKQLGLTRAYEGSLEFSQEVNNLRKSVEIKLIENTRMAIITATSLSPERARDIANAVAQAYIDQDRLSRLQAGRDSVRWLNTQLADMKVKLRNSEEVFQNFKEREEMISLDDTRSEKSQEIAKLNASYVAARADRLTIETIISRLEPQNEADMNIPIALLNSPTLQELGMELAQLQTKLMDKRKLFKDTYPGVMEFKDRIQSTAGKILVELERQRDFLQIQEQSFLARQEAKRSEILKLGRKELEYLTLEREVTTNREMYNTLLSKVKGLSLTEDSRLNNIRIAEPAELPIMPVSDKRTTLVLGGILGLLLGAGFAFFLKYLDNTIRTPDDVEQHLNLPVLSVVPWIPEVKQNQTPLLMLERNLKNASAEAYRSLRTNILFYMEKTSPKIIVITSTGAEEGKSITVVNLGMALAQAGKKVLLVDADLRRPTLHRVFHVDRNKGLSTVLTMGLPLDEAVVVTDVPNLSVLAAGSAPPDPSEILGSAQMKDLIHHVREQYNVILLDTAPVLGMTDTVALASESDTVVMVIKAGAATRKAMKIAMTQLEQVGAQIRGIVLNSVDVRRNKYYNYYRYSQYENVEEGEPRKLETGKRSSGRAKVAGGRL